MPSTLLKESDCAGRRRALLPASIVFPPRELKHYRRWQLRTQTNTSSDALGMLPSAPEYYAFKAWREQEKRDAEMASPDPLQWSDDLVAHLRPQFDAPSMPTENRATRRMRPDCNHNLQVDNDECLPCIITNHIMYMRLLHSALNEAGGLNLPRQNANPEHEQVFDAWYAGKLDLVHILCRIQELEGRDDSAKEALKLYWSSVENSLAMPAEQCDKENETWTIKRRDSAQLKKVGFTVDTNFAEGRNQAYFRKGGPRTEMSESSIDSDEDLMDNEEHQEAGNKAGIMNGHRAAREDMDDATAIKDITHAAKCRSGPVIEFAITFGTDSDDDSEDESDSDMEEENDGEGDSEEDSDDDDDEDSDWDVLDCDESEDDGSFIVFGE